MSQFLDDSPQQFRLVRSAKLWMRILGLPWLAFGGWLAWSIPANLVNLALGRISGADFVECIPGMILSLVIGLPLAALGWCWAFGRWRMEFDLERGELRDIRDFVVCQKTSRTPLAEIERIELHTKVTEHGKSSDADRSTYVSTEVDACLANGKRVGLESVPAKQIDAARALAQEIGTRLNVPVVDATA